MWQQILFVVSLLNQLLVTEAKNYIESIFWIDFKLVYIEFVDDHVES